MLSTTEGDAGDIVYLLAILAAVPGGPHTLLIERHSEKTKQKNLEIAKSLLRFCGSLVLAQEYIKEFRILEESDAPEWRSGGFRPAKMHSSKKTLISAHLNHFKFITGTKLGVDVNRPWLSVEPLAESFGRVVVNRTERYQNPAFPWKQVVSHYGDRIIFVGLEHEHQRFCASFGEVYHRKTESLLEVAELIKGSALFIGNQSCAFAVAEGMKHRVIQETYTSLPDCIFIRENAQHVYDGACALPDISGSGELTLSKVESGPPAVNRQHGPPDGWHFRGKMMGNGFHGAMERMMRLPEFRSAKRDLVESALIDDNVARSPAFFARRHPDPQIGLVLAAIKHAESLR